MERAEDPESGADKYLSSQSQDKILNSLAAGRRELTGNQYFRFLNRS